MSKIVSGNYRNSLPEGNFLLLFINNEEISCAVADRRSSTFIAFESFKIIEGEQPITALSNALNNSEILSIQNYRKVVFCSGFRKSTIIPEALFDSTNIKDQLQFSVSLNSDDEVLVDEIQPIQAVNVFAVPESIHQLLSNHFSNLEIHHSSTATVSYLLASRQNYNEKRVSVIVHESYFEIIVTQDTQLLFYNSFNYFTDEEFVYYILFVCEQLNLNPESTNIYFAGNILEDESGFTLVSKYFPKSKLANRPESFNYSEDFEILPVTFHYQLFSQLICVS